MRTSSWRGLDARVRAAVLLAAGIEAGLKLAALIDIAQRSPDEVVGGRSRWVVAILVLDTFGLLPVAYFLRGRR